MALQRPCLNAPRRSTEDAMFKTPAQPLPEWIMSHPNHRMVILGGSASLLASLLAIHSPTLAKCNGDCKAVQNGTTRRHYFLPISTPQGLEGSACGQHIELPHHLRRRGSETETFRLIRHLAARTNGAWKTANSIRTSPPFCPGHTTIPRSNLNQKEECFESI